VLVDRAPPWPEPSAALAAGRLRDYLVTLTHEAREEDDGTLVGRSPRKMRRKEVRNVKSSSKHLAFVILVALAVNLTGCGGTTILGLDKSRQFGDGAIELKDLSYKFVGDLMVVQGEWVQLKGWTSNAKLRVELVHGNTTASFSDDVVVADVIMRGEAVQFEIRLPKPRPGVWTTVFTLRGGLVSE